MNTLDTIAAFSSAVARAARIVFRVSGSRAHAIAREVAEVDEISPASARWCRLRRGGGAWFYGFVAPRSYTGEDLVEFHVPGSPVLARLLLEDVVRLGARPAEPGEFTARAYFNGRIDLTQAEGVAATIGAQSERELRAARQLLAGELARRVRPVMDEVAQCLALLEVGIDFTDEDVSFISADEVRARATAAVERLDALLAESARFERLAHEPRVVLVGRPNAGKSTLLNALAGRPRAVVSDVAGTTRDAIAEDVRLARGVVRVVDVAGLEGGEGSKFRVQGSGGAIADIARQMREHAMREAASADLVVLVHDPTSGESPLAIERVPDLVVHTKADLPGNRSEEPLSISAKTGGNVEAFRERLDALAFGPRSAGSGLALNARHVGAVTEAREALARAIATLEAGPELVALELREALNALGHILGQVSPDDLLGRIFSAFCIGK